MNTQKIAHTLLQAASQLAESMAAQVQTDNPLAYETSLKLVEQGGFIEVAVQLDADNPRIRLNICSPDGETHTLGSIAMKRLLTN